MKLFLVTILLAFQSISNAVTAQSGQYNIDLDHSNITFSVGHLGIGEVVGRFNKFSGTFTFVPNGDSSVSVEIETASVDTNQAQRDAHLRRADFFDVARFPKMKFESRSVSYDSDGNPASIVGSLTMHGVTKEVTLNVAAIGSGDGPFGAYRAGFTASTSLKRSDFGMNSLLNVAGDEIEITINVEGTKN